MKSVGELGWKVRQLEWNSTGELLALSGDFALHLYSVSSAGRSSIRVAKTFERETLSSASYLKFAEQGQSLFFDMQRELGFLSLKKLKCKQLSGGLFRSVIPHPP